MVTAADVLHPFGAVPKTVYVLVDDEAATGLDVVELRQQPESTGTSSLLEDRQELNSSGSDQLVMVPTSPPALSQAANVQLPFGAVVLYSGANVVAVAV